MSDDVDIAEAVRLGRGELARRLLDEDTRRGIPAAQLVKIVQVLGQDEGAARGELEEVDPVEWVVSLRLPAERAVALLSARIGVPAEEAASLIAKASQETSDA